MITNGIKKLRKWFIDSDENEELYTPKDAKGEWILQYQNTTIGYLSVAEGVWSFKYDEGFKKSENFQSLIDFPSVDKVYKASHLWPFFSHRIPGLGQPNVQEIVKNENIDKHNEVDLLKRFGSQTITNPFKLKQLGY